MSLEIIKNIDELKDNVIPIGKTKDNKFVVFNDNNMKEDSKVKKLEVESSIIPFRDIKNIHSHERKN